MSEQNRSNAASLGCGTLIIIALIVLFLGRVDLDPTNAELAALRRDVANLRTEVQTLRGQQRTAQTTLDTIAAKLQAPSD